MKTRNSSLVTRRAHLRYDLAQKAVRYLAGRWPAPPRIGIVLGSGLGDVVRRVRDAKRIPYKTIPHFPQPTVRGHAGVLHLGHLGRVPVAVLEGRLHFYEGYSAEEISFPARVLALAGIECLFVTCAAGGIAPRATPGSFMIFSDHLNLQGTSPLAGPHDARWGPRFPDLTYAYDPALRRCARKAAARLRLKCFEGVYAALLGPSYETPAEIRALRRLGADAVGMSAVPEVLVARQMGVRVLAVATITNRAAGLGKRPLNHREVLSGGKRAAGELAQLLEAVVQEAL